MGPARDERRRRGIGEWIFLGGPALVLAVFEMLFQQGYCNSPNKVQTMSEAKASQLETIIKSNDTVNLAAHEKIIGVLQLQGETIIKNQTQIDGIIRAQDRMYQGRRDR